MTDINKFQGLSYDFQITEEGKLGFTEGHQKANDNFLFFFAFAGWFRVYYQDFCSPLWELVGRSSIVFNSLKILVFGRIRKSINRYMPYVELDNFDLFNDPRDRKSYILSLVYRFNVRLKEEDKGKLFTAKIVSNGN